MILLETVASFIVGTIGTFMLIRGKKKADTKLMIWGGVLIVASYFLFSGWGGNDDSSKAVINNLIQATPGQQQP
jgi:hypothetical protein